MPWVSAPYRTLFVGSLCLAVGIGVGRCSVPQTQVASPEVRTQSVASREPKRSVDRRRIHVTQVRDATEDEADDCGRAELRAGLLQGQLDQCRAQRAAKQVEWPGGESPESAESWPETMDEALSQCGLADMVEMVDCDEYPCAAGFRLQPGVDLEGARADLHRRAMECDPLREAFGIAEDQADAIVAWPVHTNCGGRGRDTFIALTVLDPDGPGYANATNQQRDPYQHHAHMAWYFRRWERVSSQWDCGGFGDAAID